MRKNSIKNIRINGEVQRELSEIIRTEIKDPRVAGTMISVVSADVTPDLKYCKAYISVLGGEDAAAEDALAGLKSAVGYIRRELAKRIKVRYIPEPLFVPDDSIAYGMKMSKIIDECIQEDEEKAVSDDISLAEEE